jgi:hypothetical protein
VGRPTKCAIGILATLVVCMVLTTPKLDELPITVAHLTHFVIPFSVAGISLSLS